MVKMSRDMLAPVPLQCHMLGMVQTVEWWIGDVIAKKSPLIPL